MNISRYFIRGVKSQICPNIKFYSVRPIFTPILGNMEIETLVLAYYFFLKWGGLLIDQDTTIGSIVIIYLTATRIL